MNKLSLWSTAFTLALVLPTPVLAYIGPGPGLSAIGTVVALIGAFFLLIVGFVWYPIKRVLRGLKSTAGEDETAPVAQASADPEPTTDANQTQPAASSQ